MKLGLYANGCKAEPLEAMLAFAAENRIEMVELGCGDEAGFAHCQPTELLQDEKMLQAFQSQFRKFDIGISALSCHGNPISPDKATASRSDTAMRNAVLLAKRLGLDTICCFSGCPGDHLGAKYPNWITTGWPLDCAEAYQWQWDEVLVPYWKDFAAFARENGVTRIALELHPGQMCYNPASLLKLRALAGEEIGVNLDFSHLLWQGMEPVAVINELRDCIYHMHGKDIGFDEQKVREDGLITSRYFDAPMERSWNFRTMGYGHDDFFWKNIFAQLRKIGYDYVVSIEAECELLDRKQSIQKSARFLREALIFSSKEITWVESVRQKHKEKQKV